MRSRCTSRLFAHCRGVYFRFLDAFGDPVVVRGGDEMLRQIGFDEDEVAAAQRQAGCFAASIFCATISPFRAASSASTSTGLDAVAPRLTAKTVDIVFAFDDVNPRLAAAVRKEMFALYAAPAANLFEKTPRPHSGQVEPARISCRAGPQPHARLRAQPHPQCLCPYSRGAAEGRRWSRSIRRPPARSATGLCYTVRRLPRRRTAEKRKYGRKSDYTGTDMFLSLGERADPEGGQPRRRIERAGALHQPAFDRASAGRRGRRGFPLARRRRARIALRRRTDAAARTDDDRDGRQGATAPRPATSRGGSSTC